MKQDIMDMAAHASTPDVARLFRTLAERKMHVYLTGKREALSF